MQRMNQGFMFGVMACAGLAASALGQVVQGQRAIGFTTFERAYDIIQTDDGGYLTVGSIGPTQTAPQDIYIVRYDKFGNDVWSRVIGSANQQSEIAYSVRQTSDGGFIVAGETNAVPGFGIFVMRLDALGNTFWSSVYPGNAFFDFPSGVSIRELPDGTFAVVGKHQFAGAAQVFGTLLRVSPGGGPIVQRVYTQPGEFVGLTDLRHVRPGFGPEGFMMSGWIATPNLTPRQALLVRTDLMGNIIWARSFLAGTAGGSISADGIEMGLSFATSMPVWINGRLQSAAGGPMSTFVARVDTTPVGIGALPWTRTFANMTPGFAALENDRNRFLVMAGSMSNGFSAAAKLDLASGAYLSGFEYGTTASTTLGHAITVNDCGRGYAVAGNTTMLASNGAEDVHLALTDPMLSTRCREIPLPPPVQLQLTPREVLASTFIQGFQPWTTFNQPRDSGNIRYCLTVSCVADVDDGSGTGTPDGGVTIDDLLYWLTLFESGSICADVDDGSGTGTPDGGVTIDDLLYWLARFEAGC